VSRVAVARRVDVPTLQDLQWAKPWVEAAAEVPSIVAYPYRIFLDRVVGAAYVLDTRNSLGAIWIRDEAELDLRSLITPFRIMMSWIASLHGGEVVHASAAVVDGKAIAFSGVAGSGKSTLALSLAQAGHNIISDDCVLVQGQTIHAIYSRAKVDRNAQELLGMKSADLQQLPTASRAKSIVDLTTLPTFRRSAKVRALCMPVIGKSSGVYRLSSRESFLMLQQFCLNEILGGGTRNLMRLAQMSRVIPSHRLLLTSSLTDNVRTVQRIVEEMDICADSEVLEPLNDK